MTWAVVMPHRGQTTVPTRFAIRLLLIYLDDGPGLKVSRTVRDESAPILRDDPIELRGL